MSLPYDASGMQHLAVSAPTTPPRIGTMLAGEVYPGRNGRIQHSVDVESKVVGAAADKRKSVTYAPTVNLSPDSITASVGNTHGFSRPAGAKSMPASRRTSASDMTRNSHRTFKASLSPLNVPIELHHVPARRPLLSRSEAILGITMMKVHDMRVRIILG